MHANKAAHVLHSRWGNEKIHTAKYPAQPLAVEKEHLKTLWAFPCLFFKTHHCYAQICTDTHKDHRKAGAHTCSHTHTHTLTLWNNINYALSLLSYKPCFLSSHEWQSLQRRCSDPLGNPKWLQPPSPLLLIRCHRVFWSLLDLTNVTVVQMACLPSVLLKTSKY